MGLNFKTSFLHRRFIIVTLLGFSSGLPRALVGATLVAMLTSRQIDVKTLGYFANVAMPYSFHWAWAPFMDHVRLPFFTARFGRRVGWILLSQLMVMAALAWMGMRLNDASFLEIGIMAAFIAFFSASQDVVVDAYRTEYLDKEDYGKGAACGVFGYRVGVLVSGGGSLILAGHIAWSQVYFLMSALMLIGVITALIGKEPKNTLPLAEGRKLDIWIKEAVIAPFQQFIRAHPQAFLILLFIIFYKLPDGFINLMTTRFFLDLQFTTEEIGKISKLYGFFAIILGGFAGGALLDRIGLKRALLWFFLLHLTTIGSYILLNNMGHSLAYLTLSVTLDYFTGGMVTSALVALLMSLCDKHYTATQYALLGALPTVAGTMLANGSGWLAERMGWSGLFITAILLGLPALALLKVLWRNPSISLTSSR